MTEDEKNTCCPLIQWETHGDDDKHTSGYESGESGSIKVLGTLDVPGFLRVIVRAGDLNGKPINSIDVYEGGAGAEIEKIDQGMPDPADYDVFWAGEIAAVKAFTPEIIEKVQIPSSTRNSICTM